MKFSGSNSLQTALRANPNLPLKEFLENKDLFNSLKNEIPEIMNYLIPLENNVPKSSDNFEQIVLWALFPKEAKLIEVSSDLIEISRRVYSRNSANILSSVCRELSRRIEDDSNKRLSINILKYIMEIESKEEIDPETTGHFVRILEACLRYSLTNSQNQNFYKFIINNFNGSFLDFVQILINKLDYVPIRECLTHLISDIAVLKPDEIHKVYLSIIERAARYVIAVSNNLVKKGRGGSNSTLEDRLKDFIQSIKIENQPFNSIKQIYPLPECIFTGENDNLNRFNFKNSNRDIIQKTLYDKIWDNIDEAGFELFKKLSENNESLGDDNESLLTSAYFCLGTVKTIIKEKPQHVTYLQNAEIIETLILTGICCDAESIVGTNAFMILSDIIYGVRTSENKWVMFEWDKQTKQFHNEMYHPVFTMYIPEVKEMPPFEIRPLFSKCNENPNGIRDILVKYGEKLVFDYRHPTTNILSAFHIFWDIEYEVPSYMQQGKESQIENGPIRKPNEKLYALELMAPLFFTEPVINNYFNMTFLEVFVHLDIYLCQALIAQDDKKIQLINGFYRHFVDTKIPLLNFNKKNKTLSTKDEFISSVIQKMLPLETNNDEYRKALFRPVTNGFLAMFMRFITESNISPYLKSDETEENVIEWKGTIPDPYAIEDICIKALMKINKSQKVWKENAVPVPSPDYSTLEYNIG